MKQSSISYNKTIYLICMFFLMLTNGALVNYVFSIPPFNMWRQIIWILGLYFLLKFFQKTEYSYILHPIIRFHKNIFIYIFLLSIFTFVLLGFNPIRLGYAFWTYFAGLPFLILPFLYSKSNVAPKKLINFLVYSGLFFCSGLIVDFLTGGLITLFLGIDRLLDADSLEQTSRYLYTAEAPTTFSVVLCLQLICLLWKMNREKSTLYLIIDFIILAIYFVGSWFTGSRQLILVLSIVVAIAFAYQIFFTKKGLKLLVISTLLISVAGSSIYNTLYSNDSYASRYSAEDIKEDKRSVAWKTGFNETILDPAVLIFGNGIGYTSGKAGVGEKAGNHYENSYFARISDTGFIGLILLLFPVTYFFKRMSYKRFVDVLFLAFYLSYLIICFVSPNGASPTTQMAIYLGLGMFICKDYFFK